MNKLLALLLAGFVITPVQAQKANKKIRYQNTIEVLPTDSPERIIEKAAHVIPTENQLNALRNEFIAFIHFGPNSFTRLEWGNGMEDPMVFDLKSVDTDQWCEAMVAADMKMVIITVKHHDGFVLWQSRYTDHGIMSTPFQDGKGDILKELSKSCQKYGLKLGVYLSPADLFQIENPEGLYGNLSKYSKRTIPREVEGRPFANKTKFEFEVDDYNEYFLNQLYELLTEYGPIHEVWFDGAHPKTKGGQKYNYAAWKTLIKKLAPKAVIFGREDIRWCGNESGKTRNTEWNVVGYSENPNTTNYFPDMTDEDLGSREALLKAKYLHYQQAETNTSIREGWFYRDDTHQKVRSADDVFDIYERAVGGNSTFLLNIPPNREGKFSARDIASLKETGQRIRETYGVNLLDGAKGPKKVLDKDDQSGVVLKNLSDAIIISTPNPIRINRIVLQEAIRKYSERVEKHAVDAWIDGEWKEIASATNIGYKRILRFPEVETNSLRLRVLEARETPCISTISAHYYQSRPPQLTSHRNIDGLMTLEALQTEFNWKAHGEDIAKNLNADLKIFYTTDGSEPTTTSKEFSTPFEVEGKDVKAVAYSQGKFGPVYHTRVGYIKKDWTVTTSSAQDKAQRLIDENPQTYWTSNAGSANHWIVIDMSAKNKLSGFAYTPQTVNGQGMLAKGTISISNDGVEWTKLEDFEFGNLINDPSQRFHYFENPVEARYIRIESTEIAANGDLVTVAEFDLF